MRSGPPERPSVRERVAHLLATWFGCGLSPIAPGTVGTLGALPLYVVLMATGGRAAVTAAAFMLAAIGVWAASVVVRRTGSHDPPMVVIDEVAGILLALAVAPPTVWGIVCAVALFRVFDITKLWPARDAERLPSGWGVVADDLVAGAWTALSLLAMRWLHAV